MFQCQLTGHGTVEVDGQQYLVEVTRTLELPFAPTVGLHLDLQTDDDSDDIADIFGVDSVYWVPQHHRFDLDDDHFCNMVMDSVAALVAHFRGLGWEVKEPQLYGPRKG